MDSCNYIAIKLIKSQKAKKSTYMYICSTNMSMIFFYIIYRLEKPIKILIKKNIRKKFVVKQILMYFTNTSELKTDIIPNLRSA